MDGLHCWDQLMMTHCPSRYWVDRPFSRLRIQPALIFPHHLPFVINPSLSTIMKSFALLTASVLLGTASAEVYKLKLNKVPLSEQLVSTGRLG